MSDNQGKIEGIDSLGNSEAISKKSYSWDSFVRTVTKNPFLDSLVDKKIESDRSIKEDLNIVRAQLELLDSIITGDDSLYQTVDAKKSAEMVGVVNNLNKLGIIPDETMPSQELSIEQHICSQYPDIKQGFSRAPDKIKSLICAFTEIAEYFKSHNKKGRNVFHFLALGTIQSRGVGIKSKLRTIFTSGLNAETIENERDPTGILPRVLDYLCEETTFNESMQPPTPYLAQFLRRHEGIQAMIYAEDDTGTSPKDIVNENKGTTNSKCFINNIEATRQGGKSRRSRKQKKRASKSKKSKKSRKTFRK
jgi:hypothetical protein